MCLPQVLPPRTAPDCHLEDKFIPIHDLINVPPLSLFPELMHELFHIFHDSLQILEHQEHVILLLFNLISPSVTHFGDD